MSDPNLQSSLPSGPVKRWLLKRSADRKTALIWSACPTDETGQSQVTRAAAKVLMKSFNEVHEFYYQPGSISGYAGGFFKSIYILIRALLSNDSYIYSVVSRSGPGFLRDIPVLVAGFFAKKSIIHVHGSDLIEMLSAKWYSPLARFLYSGSRIAVPSKHIVDHFADNQSLEFSVVENFYAAPKTSHDPKRSRLKFEQHCSILWNSNVMASKGFFDLTEALDSISRDGVSFRFQIIGRLIADEVMGAQELSMRFKRVVGEPWAEYHGPVSAEDATLMLAEADIVTLPSFYKTECQPLALIQALCQEKRILIANTPALNTTVGDYPVRRSIPRDSGSIASELKSLIIDHCKKDERSERALRDGAAKAKQRFSFELFKERLLESFDNSKIQK